jgi:hypothetical protein
MTAVAVLGPTPLIFAMRWQASLLRKTCSIFLSREAIARHGCQLIVLIGQDVRDRAPRPGDALGDGESTIEQQPANLANDGSAMIDHPLPGATQGLDILLLDGLLQDTGDMRLRSMAAWAYPTLKS